MKDTYRDLALDEHKPFKYEAVDLKKLSSKSKLSIKMPLPGTANFIKNKYLASNIIHTGGMVEYLVFLDDMLLGLIGYNLSKVHYESKRCLYLLCDVTTSREAKLSKLVAKIALSGEVIQLVNEKLLNRFEFVVTTARSKNPVSMKYRGTYQLWRSQG